MAVKVSVVGTYLVFDNGVKKTYFTKAWTSAPYFDDKGNVVLKDQGISDNIQIKLTEFQDGAGTPLSTEDAIVTYLSEL